jgi:NADP-reducing hydrogenase subunit HndB
MPKLTVEDLKRIREKTAAELSLRQTPASVLVTVHVGDCGLAAGARDIMKTFMKELSTANRTDIRLLAADCIDPENCGNEPKVTIKAGDAPPVVYQNVTPEKAVEIFSSHVLGGEVVTAYVMN